MKSFVNPYGRPLGYGLGLKKGDLIQSSSPSPSIIEGMTYATNGTTVPRIIEVPDPVGWNTGRYWPLVTAPNGYIYATPFRNDRTVAKIDPVTRTITTFSLAFATYIASRANVVAPNGCIYMVPTGGTYVWKIDTSNDSSSTFGSLAAGSTKWFGGVLAPNGKIYCIPHNAANVLVIDPSNDTVYTIGTLSSATSKWTAGVLGPDGKIYGIPYNANEILVIDPTADTCSTFGDLSFIRNGGVGDTYSGNFKYGSAFLGYDNKIYCFPYNTSNVLIIDVATRAFSAFPILNKSNAANYSSNYAYGVILGGVLAANQKAYGGTGYAELNSLANVMELDYSNQTYSSLLGQTLSSYSVANSTSLFYGACLAPNGDVWISPYGYPNFLCLTDLPPAVPEMWNLPKDLSSLPTSLYNKHSNRS